MPVMTLITWQNNHAKNDIFITAGGTRTVFISTEGECSIRGGKTTMIKIPASLAPMQPALSSLLKDKDISLPKEDETEVGQGVAEADSLSDSLEEIGAMFSEKVEGHAKSLGRSQLQRGSWRGRGAVEKIEHLSELYQLLESQQQARLEAQLSAIRSALQRSSSDPTDPITVERLIEAADHDAARCNLLLRMTLHKAENSGDELTAAAASHGLDVLLHERGEEVRAGMNTAGAIAGFTGDPQEKQALRNLYYQTIHDYQPQPQPHTSAYGIFDMLLAYIKDRGQHYFTTVLRTFQRALADDIAALAPSITLGALRLIQAGLNKAGQLSHTLAASAQLLERLDGKLPLQPVSGVDLTRRLIHISHNGVYSRDLFDLGKDTVGDNPRHLALFFSGLHPVVYQMPAALWQDAKNRTTALTLLRAMITHLAAREKRG
ncbi:TyeA family type III secretion system gatekeeper subunit [Sodalis sp. dw_96]|uniref:TyeA family type III secretion system gatekeeper subunit n=1 Tax=Sodalis sp. dw_96 TaxID=2719794 RepID=UPI001BD47886|nr:TyeA family type III secretion system gatekeeper subunit [Sodalis sp. dw_96]